MIRVKLKQELAYKGHYQYQYVNKERIRAALAYLKASNIYYRDIDFTNDWINPHDIEDEVEDGELQNIDYDIPVLNVEDAARTSDHASASTSEGISKVGGDENNGLILDTRLQSVHIGQDILDNNYENIINLSPVVISTDKTNDLIRCRSFCQSS